MERMVHCHDEAGGLRAVIAIDDPSPWTAHGVWAGIRAAARQADGATELRGMRRCGSSCEHGATGRQATA